MSSYIECFKNYEIKPIDSSGDYEIVMVNNDESNYISSSYIDKITEYLKQYNLSEKWRSIIPIITEITDAMTKEKAECLVKHLVEPKRGIEFVSKNNIKEKIREDKPEQFEGMLETLEDITKKWTEGYYLIEWW